MTATYGSRPDVTMYTPSLTRCRPVREWCFRSPERRHPKRRRRRPRKLSAQSETLRESVRAPLPPAIFEAAVTALVALLRAELRLRN